MMTRTLLLVSENEALRRIVEATLAAESVSVCTVAAAAEAAARIQAEPPDVVLVDADAPVQNGHDVVTFVKLRPGLASTPVWLVGRRRTPVTVPGVNAPTYDAMFDLPLDPPQLAARARQLSKTNAKRAAAQEEESFDAFLERLDARLAGLDTRKPHTATEPAPEARTGAAAREVTSVPTLSMLLDGGRTSIQMAGESLGPQASDATVDEVTKRVMARLSSGSMQEIVSRLVLEVVKEVGSKQ
jgi:DNA-binding response OmpR family regulator